MANSRWFPVNSKTGCLLKWIRTHLSLWENQAASCRLSTPSDLSNHRDFHNSSQVLRDRQAMLNGEWPSQGRGCESCHIQERSGGLSIRQHWLQQEKNKALVPQELTKNPWQIEVNPKILSLFFTNKCNMKCLYCNPKSSSSWLEELQTFRADPSLNWFSQDMNAFVVDENRYQRTLERFWPWFHKICRHLAQLEFQGGEPLLQKEVWDCLHWLKQFPNPDLEVILNTSLQVDSQAFEKGSQHISDLSHQIRKIRMNCSLDGWGEGVEYIRHGLDLKTFEQNLNQLLALPEDKVEICLHVTISSLSLPFLLPLLEKVKVWNRNRPIKMNFEKCLAPGHLDPDILPVKFFREESEQCLRLYHQIYGPSLSGKRLDRILTDIQITPTNFRRLEQLVLILTTLDLRRGTNWQKTFPWLQDLCVEKTG